MLTVRTSTPRLLTPVLLQSLFLTCCLCQWTRNQRDGPIGPGDRHRLNLNADDAYNQQWWDDRGLFQDHYAWAVGPSGSSHGFLPRPGASGDGNVLPTSKPGWVVGPSASSPGVLQRPRGNGHSTTASPSMPERSIYPERYLPKKQSCNTPWHLRDNAEDAGNHRNALGDFPRPGERLRAFVRPREMTAPGVGAIVVNTVRDAAALAPTAKRPLPSYKNSRGPSSR